YFYENLKFDPKINIFLGDNAQGKTNLLEAVFFCANATSFKKIKDSDLIMFKENEMNLKALIQKNNSFKKIDINVTKEKKTIIVNDIKYKKNRDLKALFNIVTFTPEDLRIAKEGPSLRREFFDDIIVSV